MASVVKKKAHKLPSDHPLNGPFNSVEEGAQAKAEYVMNTVLKDFDWNAFMAKKEDQASQK